MPRNNIESPFISLILPVKNAMPYLRSAMMAMQSQTYQHFELIVQDGGSTDGTLEYLESLNDFPQLKWVSQPDSGMGEAYGKAMEKCSGDLVCFTAADERLFPDSLKRGCLWFKETPDAAAIFGGVSLIDEKGKEIRRAMSKPFDYSNLIQCNYFPTFGGLFNRKIIGEDFYYDPVFRSAPDYDFWLRLGARFSGKELVYKDEVFNQAILGRVSSSYRVESFTLFCQDKSLALSRMKMQGMESLGMEGIFDWAARECMGIEGVTSRVIQFSQKAQKHYHQTIPSKKDLSVVKKIFSPKRRLFRPLFRGGDLPWGYIKEWKLEASKSVWVCINLKVRVGSIGVCLLDDQDIKVEKLRFPEGKKKTLLLSLKGVKKPSLVIRNGGITHSQAKVYEVTIMEERCIK